MEPSKKKNIERGTKILMSGQSWVGKTSLVFMFVNRKVKEKHPLLFMS